MECPLPGVYEGVPAHIYHSWEAVSSTILKGYAELPAKAREPWQPTDDAAVGSGIHAYSLQGMMGLKEECVLATVRLGRSVKDLEAKSRLAELNPGKTILPAFYGTPAPGQPIIDILKGVDKELHKHIKIGPVLRSPNTKKELSIVWNDIDTGIRCKARLDIWDQDNKIIWDLKKTRSINGFKWQITDLHYDIQAGFYTEGACQAGLPAVGFGFIPIEAFPPYQVAIGLRNKDRLAEDRYEAKRLMSLLIESYQKDFWPTFPPPIEIYSWDQLTPDDLVLEY